MDYEPLRILDGDDAATRQTKRHILAGLLRLRRGLDGHIASASEGAEPLARGLRLATWNIRELAERNKYGRRLEHAYWYLAEILSRFDLVALQEVRGDLGALRRLLRHLGPHHDFLATDVTEGGAGNGERMVFLYDTRRVDFAGVAGELTLSPAKSLRDARGVELSSPEPLELRFPKRHDLRLPPDTELRERDGQLQTAERLDLDLPDGAALTLPAGARLCLPAGTPVRRVGAHGLRLARTARYRLAARQRLQLPRPLRADGVLQFARTPYYVAFRAGRLKLVLSTVHIYYGDPSAGSAGMQRRVAEIERLTDLLAARARAERDQQFIVLGDFNIVGREHHTMRALSRRGFVIPEPLREIPEGTNVARDKHYDQIAYHRPRDPGVVHLRPTRAGVFDFFDHVYRDRERHPDDHDEDNLVPRMRAEHEASGSRAREWRFATWRTFQMSDHLPMWVELECDFGAEVLGELLSG